MIILWKLQINNIFYIDEKCLFVKLAVGSKAQKLHVLTCLLPHDISIEEY